MQIISLPSQTVYSNLYTLSGFLSGSSLIVTNNTSDPLFLIQQPSQPSASANAYPVPAGKTVLVHATPDPIWIRGSTGPVIVQSILETVTPYTAVDLSRDLYTYPLENFRRIRVDNGNTGFFTGREFRTFRELNIPNGGTRVIRVNVGVNTILFNVTTSVDSGSVKLTTLAGGTEGGTFNETVPVLAKNNMTQRPSPFYVSQNSLTTGGTVTGGVTIDIVRVVSANATAQQTSVGSIQFSERGVNPGIYYWKFENIGTGSVTGTFNAFWEELD